MIFQRSMVCLAQDPQQSAKESATGQNKAPWKTKNLPPEKIDSSVELAPTNVSSPPQTHSTPVGQTKELQSSSVNANNSKETTSWQGHLISANSAIVCKGYSNCFDFLNKYDKTTALSAESQAKGYLLYANDKWYTLDKHGNDLAVKAIQKSIKSKGFYVAVNGKLKGNTIIVDNLVEIIDTPGLSAPTHLDNSKQHSVDKVQGHLLGK